MAADDLAIQGAWASAALVLIQFIEPRCSVENEDVVGTSPAGIWEINNFIA